MRLSYLHIVVLLALFSFTTKPAEKPKPFAVVELFSAEGCSSCPMADELLKEMTGILRSEGKEVFSLAFHVTYWNRLGWEDPYSQEIFTERQKKYVEVLHSESLYTPQAIVNGQKEFIGGDPISFRKTVIDAISSIPAYEITAHATIDTNHLSVNYELNTSPKNMMLNIAIVENDISHKVLRGENKDRTLKHYHVVKSLDVITPVIKGEAVVRWPEDLKKENSSVILYIQNTKTMKIAGATQLNIN